MKRTHLTFAITTGLLAVLTLAGCGESSDEPASTAPTVTTTAPPPEIRGTLTILELTGDTLGSGEPAFAAGDCLASDGYSDVHRGTQVTVYNEQQQVIGTGVISKGYLINKKRKYSKPFAGLPGGFYNTGYCQYSFVVRPSSTAEFYGVEVSHRGVVTFSAKQLAKQQGEVTLTLE